MHKTHYSVPFDSFMSSKQQKRRSIDTTGSGYGHCGIELSQFVQWLESTLESMGADGVLYARCVLSILRDEEPSLRSSADNSNEKIVVLRNVDDDHSFAMDPIAGRGESLSNIGHTDDDEMRCVNLMECLGTITNDKTAVRSLSTDILERYNAIVAKCAKISGTRSRDQNESIDSGVCPSPVGSEQNYDQAFPPLSDGELDDNDDERSCGGRRHQQHIQHLQQQHCRLLSAVLASSGKTKKSSPIPIVGRKRTDLDDLSCLPPVVHTDVSKPSTSQAPPLIVSTSLNPNAKPFVSSSFGRKSNAGSVEPPFERLASASTNTPPAAPFTRQWSVRSAELFGAAGGGGRRIRQHSVGSSGLALADYSRGNPTVPPGKQPQFVLTRAPGSTACKLLGTSWRRSVTPLLMCGSMESAPGGSLQYQHIHPTAAHHHGSACSRFPSPAVVASSFGSHHSNTTGFDGPRFVLHIIGEEQQQLHKQQQQQQQHENQQVPVVQPTVPPALRFIDRGEPIHGDDPWARSKCVDSSRQSVPLLDCQPTFEPICQNDENDPHLDQFCLPKLSDFAGSAGLQHFSLVDGKTGWKGLGDKDSTGRVVETDGGVKIPVSPDTHFVPIRSESMERAYHPSAAEESDGTLYVLRRPSVDQPIKFRAERPDKECQTCGDRSLEIMMAQAASAHCSHSQPREGNDEQKFVRDGDNSIHLDGNPWTNSVWEPRPISGMVACPLSTGLPSRNSDYWPEESDDGRNSNAAQHQLQQTCLIPTNNSDVFDEEDDELLLRYVGNINLLSPVHSDKGHQS